MLSKWSGVLQVFAGYAVFIAGALLLNGGLSVGLSVLMVLVACVSVAVIVIARSRR